MFDHGRRGRNWADPWFSPGKKTKAGGKIGQKSLEDKGLLSMREHPEDCQEKGCPEVGRRENSTGCSHHRKMVVQGNNPELFLGKESSSPKQGKQQLWWLPLLL